MLKLVTALILLFSLTQFSYASLQENSSNKNGNEFWSLSRQMNLKVEQGICQREWVEDVSLIRTYKVSDYQEIVFFPCSMWSYNQGWSVFLKIHRENRGPLSKPLLFIRYSSFKGLYADSVVENISWDESEQVLTSRKYLNGSPSCGDLAGYKWNVAVQDFQVISIFKNDCTSTNNDWVQVH